MPIPYPFDTKLPPDLAATLSLELQRSQEQKRMQADKAKAILAKLAMIRGGGQPTDLPAGFGSRPIGGITLLPEHEEALPPSLGEQIAPRRPSYMQTRPNINDFTGF